MEVGNQPPTKVISDKKKVHEIIIALLAVVLKGAVQIFVVFTSYVIPD